MSSNTLVGSSALSISEEHKNREGIIGIIGTGTIGSMFVHCFSRAFSGRRLLVAGRDIDALSRLVESTPEASAVSVDELASEADHIFLAIPPEAYVAVLSELQHKLKREAVLVSVTNAISMNTVGRITGNPVVKVIPTVAQQVGRGCTLVVAGPDAIGEPVASVVRLISPFSKPLIISDDDSRTASNLAGSALALFAEFANQLVIAHDGRQGELDKRTLTEMAAETMIAVGTLVGAGYTLDQVITATAAPGGMTEAAVAVIRRGCSDVVNAAVDETFRQQKLLQRTLDASGVE